MNSPQPASRTAIGLWSELPAGARWSHEGVSRVVGFLIEGASQARNLTFRVVVPAAVRQSVEADLRTLTAVEGEDWTVHSPPAQEFEEPEAELMSVSDREVAAACRAEAPGNPGALATDGEADTGPLVRWLRNLPRHQLGTLLASVVVVTLPLALLRSAVRPVWRPVWRHFIQPMRMRLGLARRMRANPHAMLPVFALACDRLRFGPASRLAGELRAWDQQLHSPPAPAPTPVERPVLTMSDMARWANAHVAVDGWVVLFPFYTGALKLVRPKAMLLPDAIPFDFPFAWSDQAWVPPGGWPQWRANAALLAGACTTVITFSQHVARRHAEQVIGIPAAKLRPINLAPPDLAHLLPFLPDRWGNTVSRRRAADMLRAEAARRRWDYLQDFPFDQAPYVVVSTQDRATKNIGTAAEAIGQLLRVERVELKMITTATVHHGESWTRLPGLIAREQLQFDVLSTPDLPREVHAALYHCAALTIHPSFFEGIVGALPFYESVSLGTPCILARGPHIEELLESAPELADFVFDPLDVGSLMALILRTLRDREAAITRQYAAYERLCQRRWKDVATDYADAARGRVVMPAGPSM